MITILNSKLLAPNISETISRERLRDLLEEIPLRKLTTVIAGAGYGKTTLVAQAVRTYRWKTVWYRLDESDRDLVTFVSYLVAGIGKLSADFGQDTLQRIKGIEDPKAECDEILAVLISEIEKAISQDLFLVLEDFHLIQESRETNRALDFLVKNLPPNLHLIIVGRLEPELSLSRLRSTREILEIKTEDLTFTDIETDQFCRKLLGSSLKDESLKTLKRKTEGWVTGLILFYHDSKGRDQSEIEKRITDLKGSSEVISSYLYENTFENLPETSRDFLLKTSILPRLEVDFCNRYLKIDKSRDILYQLTKSQLFTSSLDDAGENFCYHHLFQEFLTKRLKDTSGQKTVRNLHAEAAELCEKLGKTEEALDHLIAAEAFAGACNLAEDALTVWMEEGRIQMIYSFLNKMPQQFLEKQSWYATIRPFLTGKFRDAIEEWQKIYRNLDKQNSIEEAHQALLAIAGSHLLLGEFVQAESKIKSLLEQKGLSESVRMQILKILIQTASSQGRIEEADRYYADLTLLLEKLDKPRDWKEAVLSSLQCFKYSNVGDLTNSLLHGEHAIKLGLKGELQIEIVYCYLTVSMSHCFLGDYAEGFRKAEQGLQLLEETGFQDESLSTQFLAFLAANTLGLGEIDAAIAYAERSIRTASGNNLGYRALGYFFLAVAHKLAGNLPLVEENLAKALRSAPKTHWWRTIIEFQSLHHTIEQGKYTDIRKFFDEAASNPEKWRSQKPSILMLQAHYYSEIGKHSSAMKMFLESLVISEKTQSGPGVFGVSPWA
ncbi:MAG: hypothetical protein GY866_30885, partial [Proteobacteria bacterium]|nr:hypothetical protein [Pseudomonadota bacterium]